MISQNYLSSSWKKMKWDSSVSKVTPYKMNDKCWIPKMNRNFSLQHHIETSVGTVDTEGQGGWILKVITYLYSAVDCSECVGLYLNFPIHLYDTVLLDTGTGEKYLNVQVPLKSYIFECIVIFFFKSSCLNEWGLITVKMLPRNSVNNFFSQMLQDIFKQ